ncbi:MAG TPA: tyrosine--tRNA ligase [Thermoleophilaceae bacterium]|nr:tyrosine--tRNA ligase [Thermoleophilaceae bacterium]
MTETGAGTARALLRNVSEALPEGALERKLREGRALRVKLGIDPTAPDIHLGHAVVLTKLREFQDAGHVAILVIGDYTARVGDPSGRSVERPELEPAEVDRNAEAFKHQAFKLLDPDRTEVRRNGEWLDMPMERLFRLARTSTVAQLLERDDFAKRHAERRPISILELLYPLLQGYDSVAVNSDVELGGTDQKFNLLLAREIQEAYGQEPQAAVTTPILPGIDGVRRMSKSLRNYVGVTEAPEESFGKLMRLPDAQMPLYYELLLEEPLDPERPAVESKRTMARGLVARFHGEEAARAAEARFDRIHVERRRPDDVPDAPLPASDPVHLPALIADQFGMSRSEARRLLEQGGVKVDGEPVDEGAMDLPATRLAGSVLQVGKRRFVRLREA